VRAQNAVKSNKYGGQSTGQINHLKNHRVEIETAVKRRDFFSLLQIAEQSHSVSADVSSFADVRNS